MEKNLQRCTDDADAGLNKQRKLLELEQRLFQLCDNKVTKIAAASIEEEEEEEKVEGRGSRRGGKGRGREKGGGRRGGRNSGRSGRRGRLRGGGGRR